MVPTREVWRRVSRGAWCRERGRPPHAEGDVAPPVRTRAGCHAARDAMSGGVRLMWRVKCFPPRRASACVAGSAACRLRLSVRRVSGSGRSEARASDAVPGWGVSCVPAFRGAAPSRPASDAEGVRARPAEARASDTVPGWGVSCVRPFVAPCPTAPRRMLRVGSRVGVCRRTGRLGPQDATRAARSPVVIFTVHAPDGVRPSTSTRTDSPGTVKLSPRATGASASGG